MVWRVWSRFLKSRPKEYRYLVLSIVNGVLLRITGSIFQPTVTGGGNCAQSLGDATGTYYIVLLRSTLLLVMVLGSTVESVYSYRYDTSDNDSMLVVYYRNSYW